MWIENKNSPEYTNNNNEENKIDYLSWNILRNHQYGPEVDDNTIKEALKDETKKYIKYDFKAIISEIERKINNIKMFGDKIYLKLERTLKILKEIYDEIPLTDNEKELKKVEEQYDTNRKILENPEFSKFIEGRLVNLTSDWILVFDTTLNLPTFNYDKLWNNFISAWWNFLIVLSYNQFKDYLENLKKGNHTDLRKLSNWTLHVFSK